MSGPLPINKCSLKRLSTRVNKFVEFDEMRQNRPGPNSKIGEFWNSNLKFKIKNLKMCKKLDEILRSLVKKFLQISDVLLVKIQNESNMTK
jgi:hypothetical protein